MSPLLLYFGKQASLVSEFGRLTWRTLPGASSMVERIGSTVQASGRRAGKQAEPVEADPHRFKRLRQRRNRYWRIQQFQSDRTTAIARHGVVLLHGSNTQTLPVPGERRPLHNFNRGRDIPVHFLIGFIRGVCRCAMPVRIFFAVRGGRDH